MLDGSTLQLLEFVRLSKRAAGPMARVSNTRVGWEDIVMLARDKAAGVAFAPHVQ